MGFIIKERMATELGGCDLFSFSKWVVSLYRITLRIFHLPEKERNVFRTPGMFLCLGNILIVFYLTEYFGI